MGRISNSLLFLAVGWVSLLPAQGAERETLPGAVVPVHYDLALVPNAQALTFSGQVTITVVAKSPVMDISLNAEGLTFDHVTIDGNGGVTTTADQKLGRETLHSAQPVSVGRHVIAIAYHGKIGRSTLGFFAMDYVGPNGPRRTLVTNFEPAAARQLLPCWDEPGLKASFTITVDAPKDRMAISNMPVAQTSPISATMQRIRFAETPKMSTYLLFLGIGDFERIHKTVDGVDVGVVVKRGDTGKAGYALDQAGRILHYYNDYFGTPFPLPKLDLVAAPGKISGGSMENWGAIFYSQEHLLFDSKTSTEDDRQLVFLVVAHEMSHQWFGDLVTMAWWDNLWLNEGFARWMQTYAADDLHPEWKTGLRALSIFENGKQADAIPSTHPIVQSILTADQAGQAFDNITYDKGAAVITMINAYVGRDAFRDGVRRYMHAHAFGNTVDSDLWTVMQEAAGKPILDIERDATRQEGVPLIRVASERAVTILSEGRFAADPSTIATAPPRSWLLPVTVENLDQARPQFKLLRAPTRFEIPAPVLVNVGQTTYARVLYPKASIDALAGRMAALSSADQFGLLNDSLALGLAGYAPASNTLALAKAVPANADPIVWQRVISILKDIDAHFPQGAARTAYRQFALKLLNPVSSRLGFAAAATDDGNIQILRASLEEVRGEFGDPAVIVWAKRILAGHGESAADKRTALNVVAGQADTATFDALLAQGKAEKDPLAKQHIFEALADVQDPTLARRMVEIAFGDDPPAGSGPYLLGALAQNHPDLTWDGALPHLKDPKLALENTMRWRIAVYIASRSALPARAEAVKNYEQTVPVPARRPFSGAIAAVRQNQHIQEKVIPEITQWVAAHGG
ncbi:MAG TPA: M1 family metallopeptidase [Rhizomicrobium sp.]|nr:M1 family metallopeptidase [Rhizomicrobium sp.]